MNFLIDYKIKNYISEKRIKNWTGLPFQKFKNMNLIENTEIGVEFRENPIHRLCNIAVLRAKVGPPTAI